MGYLQNIQSFETSVETGYLQSYDKQSIATAVEVTLQLVASHPPPPPTPFHARVIGLLSLLN